MLTWCVAFAGFELLTSVVPQMSLKDRKISTLGVTYMTNTLLLKCKTNFCTTGAEKLNIDMLPEINMHELYTTADEGAIKLRSETEIKFYKLRYFLTELNKTKIGASNLKDDISKCTAKFDANLTIATWDAVVEISSKSPELFVV